MMMSFDVRPLAAAAAMALALLTPAAQAATVTVDLDDPALSGTVYIQDTNPGYGSAGPVTLNWNPLNSLSASLIRWGGNNYSGRHAAYCGATYLSNVRCALDLTVASGFTLTLDSFWFGGWPNVDRLIAWLVIDLADDQVLAGTDGSFVDGDTGLTNIIAKSSTVGFRILFGPDGFNGGINDIVYSYAPTVTPPPPPDVSPIPLPAAGWLLLAGLGGLAAMRRRRG